MKVILVLAVLFIGFPVLEFTVLIQMGREIGVLYTILLVFGAGIVGAYLAKLEGTRILVRLQETMRAGIMPTEELMDGAIVLAAGIFLITPGFISDVMGMMLLFPPTRYPIKLLIRRMVRRSVTNGALRISTLS
jgi:UPF0716 protein FxsA